MQTPYRTLLFDLDGTITDSFPGIVNSICYALSSFGIQVEERESLRPFLGPPLLASFMKYYGFDEAKANQALEKYREYFSEKGIFENSVYPGMAELLAGCQKAGYRVILSTAKPEVYARRILDHFGLTPCFDAVCGATLDGAVSTKAQVIGLALRTCASPDGAVMIGDRSDDILGAKSHGIPSIGVLYGYGTRQELAEAGAGAIACDVSALRALLLG